MKMSKFCLFTLEYPPDIGGIGCYVHAFVEESHGEIEVVLAKKYMWDWWPSWVPLIWEIWKRRTKKQIIFIHHVFPIGTAAWISRICGGPEYVIVFHGLDIRLSGGRWKKFLLKQLSKNAHAIFSASNAVRQDALQLIPRAHITVLTPGVTPFSLMEKKNAREKLGLSQDEKIIVSIARLITRKGIDKAIEAVADIQKITKVTYCILGDGPDRERLQDIEKKTGAHLTWLGRVDNETKKLWLCSADMFILPVRDTGLDVEGFGIVYLEAALARMPSIAGKSGGASEAVLDGVTGLTVDPNSVIDISSAIRTLLQDENLRVRLGMNAYERAQKDFTWKERWELLQKCI